MTDYEIAPAAPVTPTPLVDTDVQSVDPEQETIPELSDEAAQALGKFPELTALLKGNPAAILVDVKPRQELQDAVMNNKQSLLDMGIAFYKTLKEQTVVFNVRLIPAEKIKSLDAEGKLDSIVTPLSQVTAGGAPTEATEELQFKNSPAPQPLQRPASAGMQNKVGQFRLNNLAQKSPTERAYPGAGAVLNNLAKRAV